MGFNCNALLLKDYYKAVHCTMIPENMTRSVSYWTPRMSRIPQWDKFVTFGVQAFCKEYLIDYFNENFFNRPEEEVIEEYKKYMENTLGVGVCEFEKIRKLHKLGYLPVEIVSLPEGTRANIHCPMVGITNTHPDFAWLGQALESLMSAELWYPMVCANVGYTYRQIVNKWYGKTCDDNVSRCRALGNFDFRGDDNFGAALKAGAAWCLSFVNSATVPVVPYLEQMYNCDCTKEPVAFGAVSTEHFVMCSLCAYYTALYPDEVYVYKDIDPHREILAMRHILNLYPNTSFSCVSDSYDYWNVVNNLLPILKDELLAHNGCFLVRGDSGDPVKVVTETVFKLWDIFGGTVNSKGYKVLNPHVKALYGDSITPQRAEHIYKILEENGFAAQNVSLGVGSFSMRAMQMEDGSLSPYTRDTGSFAIKAIYAEFTNKNGNVTKLPVYKDPITDKGTDGGNFKKSQKGCCRVFWKDDAKQDLAYVDGLTWEEAVSGENLLTTVFKDGKMVKETNLQEIRALLNKGQF